MKEILKSNRVRLIEKRTKSNIKDLFHDLHFVRDFKHKQIAWLLGIPRPTITKWFKEFKLPTKSCHRFTNQNLTSWLYKTGRLEKKARYEGPDRRIQQTKNNVNINFFKRWSPAMAYVLGFFAADGGMFINPRGSKYAHFTSTDKEILIKIKKLMHSNHKIGIKKSSLNDPRRKTCYLIQIGSKEIYKDLLTLGFTPKKDLTLKFPEVPDEYLNHFTRGYFDGDGSVIFGTFKRRARKGKSTRYITTDFVSGSRKYLEILSMKLSQFANLAKGSLREKANKRGYQLSYSTNDTNRLFGYMYKDIFSIDYCLKRKYNKFVKALKFKFKGT